MTRSRYSLEQFSPPSSRSPIAVPWSRWWSRCSLPGFHFFIASQSSRSVVAMTRSRCSLPKMSCFVASSSSRPVVAIHSAPVFHSFFFLHHFWTVPSIPPGNHKNKHTFNYVLHPSNHKIYIHIFKINFLEIWDVTKRWSILKSIFQNICYYSVERVLDAPFLYFVENLAEISLGYNSWLMKVCLVHNKCTCKHLLHVKSTFTASGVLLVK
ncbi:hypothetical protein ACOSP7_014495 [Xanthoceras sorbifolium]